jgi:predicted dehydrogenase
MDGDSLMRNDALKFGLVGAGRIAQSYIDAFKGVESAKLVAIADISLNAAQGLAQQIGCPAYESYQRMAEEWGLDAVIICTPPVSHPEITIHFLEQGIHVLCEKPMSIDVNSAKLMLTTAHRQGVRLTMASKFRYVDDVVRARNIIRSGILGDILMIENTFTGAVSMADRWNSRPEISGGGVLIDNGTHSIDIMRYLMGPIVEVQAVEARRSPGINVDETVQMFVKGACGGIGRIDLSWRLQKDLEDYLTIYGVYGTVCVGWKRSRYRQNGNKDWIVFGSGYDKVQAFRSNLLNFVGAVKGEEALLVTPADAMASVEVIEAAYAALRQQTWVTVAPKLHAADELDELTEERKIA